MRILITISFLGLNFLSLGQQLLASAELEAQNIDKVKVDGSFVDVYVKNGEKNYFKGVIYGNGDPDDYEFVTDIVGSTLVVKVEYSRNNYSWKSYKNGESRIDITITDGIELDIDNSSGDIFVRGLRASESKIEASSGDIKIGDAVANLDLETSSGDIEINGLIGDSEIQSTSGDQDIIGSEGNLIIKASSGDVTVTDFNGKLDITTTSGEIDLKSGIGSLDASASSGNIDGQKIKITDDSYFKTSSGDIEISFSNTLEELSFDLTASSGDLEVGNRASEKQLLLKRGGFLITGVSTSGDQEYR